MKNFEPSRARLGPIGVAVAIFILISVGLSLIYCAFPWGMTTIFRPAPAHHLRQIR